MFRHSLEAPPVHPKVSTQNTILAGNFDGFTWIRCEGKGSFANSPQMKQWAERQIQAGDTCVVVDLELCTGMDSTFMGTMAGIAMKLAKVENATLQVTGATEKSRRSLEDLGLSMLIEIEPEDAVWKDSIDTIRTKLSECNSAGSVDKTQHVFDAHKLLCDADDSNDEKFSTVLDVLEAELANRQYKGN